MCPVPPGTLRSTNVETHKHGTFVKPRLLEKQLGLWDVYAIATGATLSSGFFLLPGLAAVGAGPAMPLSYLLGAVILLPGLLSKVELATAMPRAGGIYYFLDRSMGPLVGAIGGFGTWIALVLKSAFALIGVGAYLQLFMPGVAMGPVAGGFAVFFGVVNYFGAKKTGSFQVMLLIGLLILLLWFSGFGLLQVELGNFRGFFESGSAGVVSTAGLVIVSYMGLTKVASVAEEVKNPDRNLPLGMFLAFGSIVTIYVVGTSIMVGIVGVETLARDGGDLTPVATVAEAMVGPWGAVIMTVAAVLAFSSVANAGILSASRYPLAMGRDKVLPTLFSHIGGRGTPTVGIAVTVGLILLSVTLFDPTKIAKLASAFLLTTFALACLAVIVMRESRIESYDPGYRSPFYPGLQILGILASFWLIVNMGLLPTLFTGGLITFGAMWYTYYARDRVSREGAIFHVFERLGRQRYEGLDRELREIMKDRDPREADPVDELLTEACVLDLAGPIDFEDLATQASQLLALNLPVPASELAAGFLRGTRMGVTPVSHGAALPHMRLEVLDRAYLALARVGGGVRFESERDGIGGRSDEPIRAIFFLVGPEADPGRHLRILAQIARRVDQESFMPEWLDAESNEQLKEALFQRERIMVMTLGSGQQSADLIGRKLSEVSLPDGTLIAMILRGEELIVPRGETALLDGDRVTVIGQADGIRALRERYGVAVS
ncbi:MAG: amino acid permease [Gemmatimonadota bacterium]|nr:MAG: amino acid permease [Gemmatimonadota bacterium]